MEKITSHSVILEQTRRLTVEASRAHVRLDSFKKCEIVHFSGVSTGSTVADSFADYQESPTYHMSLISDLEDSAKDLEVGGFSSLLEWITPMSFNGPNRTLFSLFVSADTNREALLLARDMVNDLLDNLDKNAEKETSKSSG